MNSEAAKIIGDVSKKVKTWGIVTLVLGALAIAAPFVTGLAVAMVVGVLLLAAGIAQMLYAFQAGSFGNEPFRYLFGGITVICGIAMIVAPSAGLASLTVILIAYFLVDGIFTLMMGLRLKPIPGWGWMVFNGGLTALLAVLIWRQWPVSGTWAIGVLLGIRMLMTGLTLLLVGGAGKEFADSRR